MTIGEYIKGKFELWGVDIKNEVIALELSVLELGECDTMNKTVNLDEFFYKVIPDFLLMPSSVSEGGFSITYNKDAITSYYSRLARLLGKPNLLDNNTITDITNKWG